VRLVTLRKGFNSNLEAFVQTLSEDSELERINARKLADLKRRIELASAPKPEKPVEKSSREVLLSRLYDRGDEVLDAAYAHYPKEAPIVVDQLAKFLKQNPKTEMISGGELLEIFRAIGLRFSLKTSIKVQERGKFVDLADKFKLKKEEDETS
jgi:DNA-binding TFAR19-related protein (PDSD5 family)